MSYYGDTKGSALGKLVCQMVLPQEAFSEFADDYNSIHPQDPTCTEKFGELAEKAMAFFRNTNNKSTLHVGFVGAACWMDMGLLEQAEAFFDQYLPFITLRSDVPESVSIYTQYARLLSFKGDIQAAADVAESLFDALVLIGDISMLLTAISLCGEAKRYDKMWNLVERAGKLHPGLQKRLVHPIMLPYYLERGEKEGVVAQASKFAWVTDDTTVSLENVNHIFYAIGSSLLHWNLHPDLNATELQYLDEAWAVVVDALVLGHERETFFRKILAFEKEFFNFGLITRRLFRSSLLQDNIDHLAFLLGVCEDFREQLEADGAHISFTLTIDDDEPEAEAIALLIQPDTQAVRVYAAQSGIVKKHAHAIAKISPGLSICADYSSIDAEPQEAAAG